MVYIIVSLSTNISGVFLTLSLSDYQIKLSQLSHLVYRKSYVYVKCAVAPFSQ